MSTLEEMDRIINNTREFMRTANASKVHRETGLALHTLLRVRDGKDVLMTKFAVLARYVESKNSGHYDDNQ
jgi:hypothetical protein